MAGATRRGPLPPEATLILEVVQGCVAHGLAREGADVELKGVLVGPRRWYLGFRGGPEQIEVSTDAIYYDLRKFFRLAVAANPGILEVLWAEPEDLRLVSPPGQRLLDERDRFLSKRVLATFAGHVQGQLAGIATHRRWLLAPPTEEESQEWESYHRWQESRSPERAALEAAHGYDTARAMHLIRLLRMVGEILREGVVQVRRPDRGALLAIRDGAFSYEDFLAHVHELQQEANADARQSRLPDEPEEKALDGLCEFLIQEVLADNL